MTHPIKQHYAALLEPMHAYFGDRVSRDFLQTRLTKEGLLELGDARKTKPQRLLEARFLIKAFLYTTLTRWWGQSNALDLQVTYNTLSIPDLPDELQGFRILHLSDLHIDAHPQFGDIMAATIGHLDADLTVITGDFRSRTFGSCANTVDMMEKLAPNIPGVGHTCYGILGNHDSITLVPELERMGIEMLVNESVRVETGARAMLLAGVDDPYSYRAADLDACLQRCKGRPESHYSVTKPDLQTQLGIALVHTPELAEQAAAAGFALYLTGHTHGGQVCWPWGKPVDPEMGINHAHLSGRWQLGQMPGYTSRGSGTSIVDVRFFCPPEVTLHTLVNRSR